MKVWQIDFNQGLVELRCTKDWVCSIEHAKDKWYKYLGYFIHQKKNIIHRITGDNLNAIRKELQSIIEEVENEI